VNGYSQRVIVGVLAQALFAETGEKRDHALLGRLMRERIDALFTDEAARWVVWALPLHRMMEIA
jgi:hypothetical protein